MTTGDALHAAVREKPEDDTARLVLADYLDENDDRVLAHAHRWMVARGLRPHFREWYLDRSGRIVRRVPERFSWIWYSLGNHPHWYLERGAPEHAILPGIVFISRGTAGFQMTFPSDRVAVHWLADALEQLRVAHSIEPGGKR